MVRIPALTTRSAMRWLYGTGVMLVAAHIWGFVTDPQNRPYMLISAAVTVLLACWMPFSLWLDTETGAVLADRGRGRIVYRMPLGNEATVTTVPDHMSGRVLLGLRPHGSRFRDFIPVLAMTIYVENSMSPDLLRLLADTLDRHGTHGADEVGPLLRAQADHLDAGGGPADSPLAALLGGRAPHGDRTPRSPR
jgi:hypothetical protein